MGIILPEGFILEKDGRDFLVLFYRGERVATFSSFGATPQEVEKSIRRAVAERQKRE